MARFDYYQRLSEPQKKIYRASDSVRKIVLPEPAQLYRHVQRVEQGLAANKRDEVQKAVNQCVAALLSQLSVSKVQVRVLLKRPRSEAAELHGLYIREEGKVPLIRVWMRTAAHHQPVRLRTFIRTLVHEVCHHLDFELLKLSDTFHTQGFFARESSLTRALLPSATLQTGANTRRASKKNTQAISSESVAVSTLHQLTLFG